MKKKHLKLEVYGPLIFWSMMFATAGIIKAFAYTDNSFWVKLPAELSLWAIGILFTLSASEQTYYNARLVPRITRQSSGYSVEYGVTVSDSIGFTPKYLYLFMMGMSVWIITILLTGKISQILILGGEIDLLLILLIGISYFLGAVVVGAALHSLHEVSQ